MADVLEYIVRLRGGAAAGAQVRGLARDFDALTAAETKANTTAAATAAAAAKKREAAIALVTKSARVGALVLAATGFEAVKLSNTYDTEMLKIRTDAGATTAELNFMKGAVLDLAKSGDSLGASPTSLAQGLYHLESLGIRGARALTALKLAAGAAAISGASLEETTSALGAAMFVGIKGAGGLDHIMGLLNATVGAGNMRMGGLVNALGTGVLPAAKLSGLSIQDVMSALAVFSDSGQKASSAAAQFATALHFVTSPTTKAQKALEQLGMTQDTLAMDMRKPNGMVTALRDLREHLAALPGGARGIAALHVLNAIFPGGRGRVLQTELVMLDRAQQKWGQIDRTTRNFAGAVEMQKNNPATRLHIATSKAQAALIKFGHTVGPVLIPVITTLITGATILFGLFAKVPVLPVILFVALLAVGFYSLAAAVWGAVAAGVAFMLTPIGAAITALIILIVLVATHFDQFKRGLRIWGHAIAAAWEWVKHGVSEVASWIASKFMSVVHFLGSIPGRIAHLAVGMWDGIKNAFRAAINWIIGAWNSLHFHVPSVHIPLLGNVGGFDLGVPTIPKLARGGVLRTAGAAVVGDAGPELLDLPAGATVTPLSHGWRGGDIVLKVAGRELARVLRSELIEQMARA